MVLRKKLFLILFLIFFIGIIFAVDISSQFILPSPGSGPSGVVAGAYCPGMVGTVPCCTKGVEGSPGAQCFMAYSIEACETANGAIQNCVPQETQEIPTNEIVASLTPLNNTANKNTSRVILNDVTASGIANNVYVPNTYDCDDFAKDLEVYLQGLGYDATFTHIVKYNSTGQQTSIHAVTDIHLPNGWIAFIEPQTGKFINLDYDSDGVVELYSHPSSHPFGYHPTDDNVKITIYDSADAAISAGLTLD